jgi:hypothetical protein
VVHIRLNKVTLNDPVLIDQSLLQATKPSYELAPVCVTVAQYVPELVKITRSVPGE